MRIDEELQTGFSEGQDQLVDPATALPLGKLESVNSWGGASESLGYVYRPATVEAVRDVFEVGARSGRTVSLRGSGNSYGDATLNSEQIVLDLRRMTRVLEWDPQAGRIRVEPGVTIRQFWEYVLEDGWWPAVVPGTSKPTIGGCAGMNVHGKNAWKAGTIGDHIYEFDLLLANGEIVTCSREQNSDLFYAAIGGFGMLGAFTSITLSLKRIYSGLLDVHALASRNLGQMMEQFEQYLPQSDYLVGWIDAFAGGKSLGRGQIHAANYLAPGVDPYPEQTLRLDNQNLPDTMFGIVPKSKMWRLMRPFGNNLGWRFVNFGKYRASRFTHDSRFRQPHVSFHFLLDYLPDWKRAYGRHGLIQYQSFVPAQAAHDTFCEMLALCQRRGLPNYLTVLKRHKPDDFMISHGLDGYSLAMDFRVTPSRAPRLLALAGELDHLVLNAGGRFYFAKDSTLQPDAVRRYLGPDTVARFQELKSRYDPGGLLSSNMWRRLFSG